MSRFVQMFWIPIGTRIRPAGVDKHDVLTERGGGHVTIEQLTTAEATARFGYLADLAVVYYPLGLQHIDGYWP